MDDTETPEYAVTQVHLLTLMFFKIWTRMTLSFVNIYSKYRLCVLLYGQQCENQFEFCTVKVRTFRQIEDSPQLLARFKELFEG